MRLTDEKCLSCSLLNPHGELGRPLSEGGRTGELGVMGELVVVQPSPGNRAPGRLADSPVPPHPHTRLGAPPFPS